MCPNDQSRFVLPRSGCYLLRSEEYQRSNVRRIDQTAKHYQRHPGQGPLRPRPLGRESPGKDIPTASPVPTPMIPLNGFSTATPAGRWSGTKLAKWTAHGPLRSDPTVLQDRRCASARLPLAGRTATPAWNWPTSNANGFGTARHCMPLRIKTASSASRRYGVSRPPGNSCFNYWPPHSATPGTTMCSPNCS